MSNYVAIINVPGYSPMADEPAIFETSAEAWAYLAEERQRDDLAWVPDDPADPDGPASLDETSIKLERAAARDADGGLVDGSLQTGTIYGPTPNGGDPDFEPIYDLGLAYSVDYTDEEVPE